MKKFSEKRWKENFRVSKKTFDVICAAAYEDLQPKSFQLPCREPLSVEKKVAIALFKLASTSEYRSVGHIFGVHKSTVHKCVHAVVDALLKNCMEEIAMPNDDNAVQIAMRYEKSSSIPQILGSIDGTHIYIHPPSHGHKDFVNRKGWTSVVLQAVVDSSCRQTEFSLIM